MATAAIADAAPRRRGVRPSGRTGRLPARLCAAVALVSVAAHLWMGWEHRAMPWEGALMLLMAAACLPCAVAVWHGGHDRGVRMLFGMALSMVTVHAVLLLAPGAMAGNGHGGMGAMAALEPVGPAGSGMAGGVQQPASMLGIIALELAIAMLAAWAMRRGRACTGTADWRTSPPDQLGPVLFGQPEVLRPGLHGVDDQFVPAVERQHNDLKESTLGIEAKSKLPGGDPCLVAEGWTRRLTGRAPRNAPRRG